MPSLTELYNKPQPYVCRCMPGFCYASLAWCIIFFKGIVFLLPSVFLMQFYVLRLFFVSVCLLVFFTSQISCLLPLSAHSTPTVFSPTVWSHPKELVVSRFSESWGEQRMEGFFRSNVSFSIVTQPPTLSWVTVCNIWWVRASWLETTIQSIVTMIDR